MLIELHAFENHRSGFVVYEFKCATYFVSCLRVIVKIQGRIIFI